MTRRSRSSLVAVSVLLAASTLLAGCALTRSGGQGGLRDIQIDEIRGAQEDNVMDLIERIRPSWLYSHNIRDPEDPYESEGPQVLLNDVPPRPLFTLSYIPPTNVLEIRYLTAQYALTRYRVDSPAGVIMVIAPDMALFVIAPRASPPM